MSIASRTLQACIEDEHDRQIATLTAERDAARAEVGELLASIERGRTWCNYECGECIVCVAKRIRARYPEAK